MKYSYCLLRSDFKLLQTNEFLLKLESLYVRKDDFNTYILVHICNLKYVCSVGTESENV